VKNKKDLICPYDGTLVNNFKPKGGVRRHDDFFVALYVFEHTVNNHTGNSVNMKNAHIPKMNSENSIIFEDPTYEGVFEEEEDLPKKSTKPSAEAKKPINSYAKKLNDTENPSMDDSVNVSRSKP
jgi:hypothetical protein